MTTCSSIHAWEIPWTEETVHGVTKESDTSQQLTTTTGHYTALYCTRDTQILVNDQERSQFKHNYEHFLSQDNAIHSNNILPCSMSPHIQEIHW